ARGGGGGGGAAVGGGGGGRGRVRPRLDDDAHLGRARVLRHVGQRLLEHGEEVLRRLLRDGGVERSVDAQLRREAEQLASSIDDSEDRHAQAALGGRLQREDRATYLADGHVKLVHNLVDPVGHVLPAGNREQRLQRHARGEEPLDDFVVKITGDALAVFEDRNLLDAPHQPGVLDRGGRRRGQRTGEAFVLLAELFCATFVAEVQVPEDGVAHADRDAEKR